MEQSSASAILQILSKSLVPKQAVFMFCFFFWMFPLAFLLHIQKGIVTDLNTEIALKETKQTEKRMAELHHVVRLILEFMSVIMSLLDLDRKKPPVALIM